MVIFDKEFHCHRAMCRVEKKCHLCGTVLDTIQYLEPDPTRTLPYDPVIRPPLCSECWSERISEAKANGSIASTVDIKRVTDISSMMALAFVSLQAADAVTTVIGTKRGWDEMNPLVAPLADSWFLLTAKIETAVFAVLCLNFLAKNTQKVKPIIFALRLCIMFMALVVFNNVIVLTFDKAFISL